MRTAAVEAASAAVDHGVKTIVEPTAMFGGRDVGFMRRVAEETGLQVVACTGIYTYDYLPPYFMFRDEDAMAELFVHDISGQPGHRYQGGVPEVRGRRARGDRERREGPPRHRPRERPDRGADHGPLPAGLGDRAAQVEIFVEEGVDPGKGADRPHRRHGRPRLHRGAARQGRLHRDGPLRARDLPAIERRNATVTALLERGYAERMFLSQDYCATIDWYPPEVGKQLMESGAAKDWSMTLVHDQVIPTLREAGMTDEQLETMMV